MSVVRIDSTAPMSCEAVVRPAAPGDLDAVAAIFAYYVVHSVVTFEETPPDPAAWRERLDRLAGRGL
ncbi:hypothetical protein GT002_30840, partial [Streptomyces sp. SID4917]|uniref:GNAT family N-acetyltransferase n=1 Tax=Streptomyces sp. MnatMP-M17 TaxID=1839780 RepID=UPI00081D5576